ncbi:MAG: CorA family divalent cation transporter [Acidimicrobiales bacterium]
MSRSRLLVWDDLDGPAREVDAASFADHLGNAPLVWLDLTAPDPATVSQITDIVDVDPLVVDDLLDDLELLPKIDDYDDQIFVVLHSLAATVDRVDTVEIDAIVTDGALVTVAPTEVVSVDWLWRAARRQPGLADAGPAGVLAGLAEVTGRRFLGILNELELRIEDLADRALEGDPDVLLEVRVLRGEEMTLRRILRPQRQMLTRMRTGTIPIPDNAKRRFSDAEDVHVQLVESVLASRMLMSDVIDTYRGAMAEDQAEAAKLVAVFAAILLPMTLVVGYFGMNFEDLPGLRRDLGWLWVTAGMVVAAVAAWIEFARRGFVRGPRVREAPRTIVRGLASAAKIPAVPLAMLRRPGSRKS